MSVILDILVLFISVTTIYLTYRKGFVRSVLGFAASILSIVFSNALAPYVSDIYLPFLTEQLSKTDKQIPDIALSLFSHALAFVTVFAVISIIFRIIITFISGVFRLPILNSFNKTLGLLLGCMKALVFLLLFVALFRLTVPFINDAHPGVFNNEVIQNTYIFKHLYNIEWTNLLVN